MFVLTTLYHRTLRQTVSWDTPMSATTTPQRTMSCDTAGNAEPSNNRCSNNGGGEDVLLPPPGISSSSSEHDNHEAGAWSSDYSNSEDEFTNNDDGVTPVSHVKYTILFFKIVIFYFRHGVSFCFIFSLCAHNLHTALCKSNSHTQTHTHPKKNIHTQNRKLGI